MYKGEDIVLSILAKKGEMTLEKLGTESAMHPDSVRRIVESLNAKGFVELEHKEILHLIPTAEFEEYCNKGTPEVRVFTKALQRKNISDLDEKERKFGLNWAKVKGLVDIEKGYLVPRKSKEEAEQINSIMAALYKEVKHSGRLEDKITVEELLRRQLILKKSTKTVMVKYTGKNIDLLSTGFDVSAAATDATIGKGHPLSLFSDHVRDIMGEMGFEEMDGSIIESCFWNFDALFQPQDHPARDLADTFYLVGERPLPDQKLVQRVKKAHENGWKYNWSEKEAKKVVLRTHTTCLSARYLAAIRDKKPRKYFSVGRVFRNEATDYKHLAEFHQVEGIIVWENATFRDLLGVLKEFYKKLGFEKIRFRPSFFPYTEPSLEVEVFFEPRKQWLELGGAGVFRPEVSIPLANIYPVLAWGLSLERPLMLMLGLEDIRTFYRNDLYFLKSARLEL